MKSANEFLFEHGIDTMFLNDDFNSQLFHAMERYAEEKIRNSDGWISVEDENKPEEGKRVLCLTDSGLMDIGYWYKGVMESNTGKSFEQRGYVVTHWQYLPEPPNEKSASLKPNKLSNETEVKNILREFIMRANYAFPMNEQDMKWFDTGTDAKTPDGRDFMERLITVSGIEEEARKDFNEPNDYAGI